MRLMCAAEPVLNQRTTRKAAGCAKPGSGTVSADKAVVEAGFKGVEIREELTRRRIAAVASWKEQRCPKPE
ncbi:hypothetical protein ECZU34_31850 [Escherichia coli]|nr:hypothetical protein ECZU34_31850 [Escherichia coli]